MDSRHEMIGELFRQRKIENDVSFERTTGGRYGFSSYNSLRVKC